jgi:putative heme transporter
MKLKLWINILTFVAIGLIVVFAWGDIAHAFAKMWTLNLWVLALMIPAQFFVFYAIAQVFRYFFKATGTPLPMKTLLPAVVELNFVNHVFPSGGVSGFSYLTMRLKHDDISTAKATLAQLARFILVFLTFIVLLLLALVMLAAEDKANRFIILIATALTFTIMFSTLVVIYVIGKESRIHGFTQGLSRLLNRAIHLVRRSHPETINLRQVERTFNELHQDYTVLRNDFGRMWPAVAWAAAANVAEVGLIYIAFVAHGAWINPGALIIAYAIATIAGLLAILPGGLGVYEPLMAAVLLSAGVPADVALSATLVSRVVALALALGSGYILYQRTIRRYGNASSRS